MIRPPFLMILIPLLACGPSEGQTRISHDSALEGVPATRETLQERLPPPKHAWVIFGADTVQAEVARTADERAQGLMYRESLARGRGMLFVFPDSQIRSFWMKNTFIPLDIAYLDAEFRIVDIMAMEPENTTSLPSTLPAMFALEVPLGWFEEMGISVGAQARLVFGPG
jgi:uncharacterized membrane protein (UPF0127 family)